MAYPGYEQSIDSRREVVSDSAQIYIAVDGSPYVRDYTSTTTYRFTVVHEYLTPTEAATILSEYESALGGSTAFTWQGDYGAPFSSQTYTCYFLSRPFVDPSVAGEFFRVTSQLWGVMD